MEYDFSGWATKNDIQCSDGRIIVKDAFKQNDGQKVPLVWNHQHDDPSEVLGHALLENREDGVYAYCKFNDTESGRNAKALVVNGDVDKLSIYANKLKSQMNKVVHGCIREVSLVLAGANPGAFIDSIITHSDESGDEEEGVIYTDEIINIANEEGDNKKMNEENNDIIKEKTDNVIVNEDEETVSHSDENDKTIDEIYNTLSEDQKKIIENLVNLVKNDENLNNLDDAYKQKIKTVMDSLNEEQQNVVYALIGYASDDEVEENEEKGENEMKHNVFENDKNEDVLIHSEIIADAIKDGKKFGSLKDSFIEHAAANNITNIDYLFPDATEVNDEPRLIKEDDSWVTKVMNGVHHSPFSRVKSTFAQLNENQAKAKGYVKGNKKTDMVLALLRRVTTPTTIYVKQTMDRDDVIDITTIDVIKFIKNILKYELNKDIATAILIGDGRNDSDQDKINELNVRPISKDDDFYSIKYTVTDGVDYDSNKESDSRFKGIIRAAIKSRKQYKGSGRPTLYTTESVLSELLLIEDKNGRVIYDSEDKLATAMRVKEIVTVPEMERESGIYGIIVNLQDYTAGADKGGEQNLFDDFDIDFNQQKYLLETRMSGALVVPYSAIVLKAASSQTQEPEING